MIKGRDSLLMKIVQWQCHAAMPVSDVSQILPLICKKIVYDNCKSLESVRFRNLER